MTGLDVWFFGAVLHGLKAGPGREVKAGTRKQGGLARVEQEPK